MAPPAIDEFQASMGGFTSLSIVLTVQVRLKSAPATGSEYVMITWVRSGARSDTERTSYTVLQTLTDL